MAEAQTTTPSNKSEKSPEKSPGKSPRKSEVTAPGQSSASEGAGSEWHPLDRLRDEVDRLFDDFNTDMFHMPFRRKLHDVEPFWRRKITTFSTPAVDIVEKDDSFEVSVELPGIDEKDIDVSLVNGSLKIAGEKKKETEKSEKDYYLHERHFGMFERCFALPENVNSDDIDATFKNGVLKVVLAKKPEAKEAAKKIAVKSA